jgi:hypothetical protein
MGNYVANINSTSHTAHADKKLAYWQTTSRFGKPASVLRLRELQSFLQKVKRTVGSENVESGWRSERVTISGCDMFPTWHSYIPIAFSVVFLPFDCHLPNCVEYGTFSDAQLVKNLPTFYGIRSLITASGIYTEPGEPSRNSQHITSSLDSF